MALQTARTVLRKCAWVWAVAVVPAIPALAQQRGYTEQAPTDKAKMLSTVVQSRDVAGAQLPPVPDLSGLTLDEAYKVLAISKLFPGKITTKDPTGVVIDQSPRPDPNRRVDLVLGRPEIILTLDNDRPTEGTAVTATILLKPAIAKAVYQFNWGGGVVDSWQPSRSSSHIYQVSGTYIISATALLYKTAIPASISVTVVPKAPPPPRYTLMLEVDDPRLIAGSTGKFTAKLTSSPPANTVVDYCFYWADNSGTEASKTCQPSASDSATTEHKFRNPGQYHVRAVATFIPEQSVQSQTIPVSVYAVPIFTLSADSTFLSPNQKTGFSVRPTRDVPSNGPLRYCYAWEQDGPEECGNSPDVTHAFSVAGIYSVSAVVEQDRDRFAAKPILIRVYEVGLTSVLSEAKADKPVHFEAKLSPDSLAKRMKYCFHWGDNTQTCGSASWADHTFTSSGRYSNFVEVFMNDVKIATSNSQVVRIGWPLWLTILVWGGGLATASAAAYKIKKARLSRTAAESSVKVTPHYDNARYKVTGPHAPKCLVRVRWVRSSAGATIDPPGNLIKKKGSAHA